MSRTLTSAAATAALARVDVEPIIIIKIIVSSTVTVWLGDKDFTVGADHVQGIIVNLSELTLKLVNRRSANAGTITVQVSDIAKSSQATAWQNLQAFVYQYFVGTTFPTDLVQLYAGVIASPVTFDEINRIFSFDIVPPIKSFQIPFSPLEDLVTTTVDAHLSTEKKFRGKPWPLPFGDVVDSPCQQVAEGPLMKTVDIIYPYTTSAIVEAEIETDPNPFNNQTTPNFYFINDERVRGAFFTGNIFTFSLPVVSNRNLVIRSVNITATRPNPAIDPDSARADVFYVVGAVNANSITVYPNVVGTWCSITAPVNFAIVPQNYCFKQIGNKCFFLTAWSRAGFTNWLVGGVNGGTQDPPVVMALRRYLNIPGSVVWQHGAGSIIQKEQNRDKVYIVSDQAHTSFAISGAGDLIRIRAYRQVPIGDINSSQTIRQLVTVPPAYYVMDPNNNAYRHTLADGTVRDPMTVSFPIALSKLGQGWEDDIVYATIGTSTRNTSDQIKYILEKYTLLSPDSSSFAAAATALANYPSDFVLTESQDALQAAIDIAWQARCSILTIGSIVKIKYLARSEPSSGDGNITIGDDYTLLDENTIFSESELEDRVTIFIADFKYSNAEPVYKRVVKRVNTTLLGEKIEHFSFYIYNNQGLVDISAAWWSQRYGRVWRKLSISGPLPFLTFEPFDFANVNMSSLLGYSNMKTIVEGVQHDTFNSKIMLSLWTPLEAGSNSASSNGWLAAANSTTAMRDSPFNSIIQVYSTFVATAASQDGN